MFECQSKFFVNQMIHIFDLTVHSFYQHCNNDNKYLYFTCYNVQLVSQEHLDFFQAMILSRITL